MRFQSSSSLFNPEVTRRQFIILDRAMQLLPSLGMTLPPQIQTPDGRIVTAVVVSTWVHLSSVVETGSFIIMLNTIDRSINQSIN
jgi:hypothetical protein